MANTSTTQTGLLTLPPELFEQVLQELAKRDLKHIRLSVRLLHDVATPWLFRSFSLYPHLQSFDKLRAITKSASGIASLVKRLDYNTAYRYLPRLPFSAFTEGRKSLAAAFQSAKRKDLTTCLQQLHQQTLMGGNTSDELLQMDFFQTMIPALTNLQTIYILEAPEDDDLPDFYSRRLPAGCVWSFAGKKRLQKEINDDPEPRQSHALAMLAGARHLCTLQSFRIQGMQWDDVLGQPDLFKRPILFMDSFGRLKSLELQTNGAEHIWDADVIVNLQDMLELCSGLERLVLWFRDVDDIKLGGECIYDFDQDDHCRSIFQLDFEDDLIDLPNFSETQPRLTWSTKLKYLELRGLICTFKEFKKVLKHCTGSLQSLHLSALILLPESRKGRRACLVTLFKWLQRRLNLEEFVPHGFFTNGGKQRWTILPPDRFDKSENLYRSLVNFVTSAEPEATCPLEHFAIQEDWFDLGTKHYSKSVPEMLRDQKYDGDSTLIAEYSEDDDIPSDTDSNSEGGGVSDETDEDLDSEDDGEETDEDEWESTSDNSAD